MCTSCVICATEYTYVLLVISVVFEHVSLFSPIATELHEFLNIFLYLTPYHMDVYKNFPLFQRLPFDFIDYFFPRQKLFMSTFAFVA